jgi:hypothetical protein
MLRLHLALISIAPKATLRVHLTNQKKQVPPISMRLHLLEDSIYHKEETQTLELCGAPQRDRGDCQL